MITTILSDSEQLEIANARIAELEKYEALFNAINTDFSDQEDKIEKLTAHCELMRRALLTCQKKQIIYECRPTENYKTYDSDLVAEALAIQPDDAEEFLRRCLSKMAEGVEPVAHVLRTGHGTSFHDGATPPKCEVQDIWKSLYATPAEAILALVKE